MSRVLRCDRCPREDSVTERALTIKQKPSFNAATPTHGDLVLDLCPDCIDELRAAVRRPRGDA